MIPLTNIEIGTSGIDHIGTDIQGCPISADIAGDIICTVVEHVHQTRRVAVYFDVHPIGKRPCRWRGQIRVAEKVIPCCVDTNSHYAASRNSAARR